MDEVIALDSSYPTLYQLDAADGAICSKCYPVDLKINSNGDLKEYRRKFNVIPRYII